MKYMWLFFVIISTVLFVVFKFYVVKIAYTKLPNGNYGELFGPISYFKNYVYCILAILFISGATCLLKMYYKSIKK